MTLPVKNNQTNQKQNNIKLEIKPQTSCMRYSHENLRTMGEIFHCQDSLGETTRHDGNRHLNNYFD